MSASAAEEQLVSAPTHTIIAKYATTADDATLYTVRCTPLAPIRALCVFVHGYGEHINRYHHLMGYFAQHGGVACFGFDQRGYGKTGLLRGSATTGMVGHSEGRDTVIRDITWAVAEARGMLAATEAPSSVPVFLFGHSMGGGRVFDYGLHAPPEAAAAIRGIISSAPLLRTHPSTSPPKIVFILARYLSYALPRVVIKSDIDPARLSRDPKVAQEYVASPYNYDRGTLSTMRDMISIGTEALDPTVARAWGGKSVLVVHGGDDTVTDPAASKEWCELVAREAEGVDLRFVSMDGWFHELHNEEAWEEVAKLYVDWMLERCCSEHNSGH